LPNTVAAVVGTWAEGAAVSMAVVWEAGSVEAEASMEEGADSIREAVASTEDFLGHPLRAMARPAPRRLPPSGLAEALLHGPDTAPHDQVAPLAAEISDLEIPRRVARA